MTDYKQPYYVLFHAMTDALSAIRKCNYGDAKDVLLQAQQQAEAMFWQNDPKTPDEPPKD